MENTRCKALLALWIPVVVYAGILFYISSLHRPSVPRFPYSDKVYHTILYAGFGLFFVRALRPMQKHWRAITIVLAACVGAISYGLTDEFHQIFVSGRSAEWWDVAADGVGGFLGGGIYILANYVDRCRRKGKIQGNDQTVAPL